jgi:hypothetical protein
MLYAQALLQLRMHSREPALYTSALLYTLHYTEAFAQLVQICCFAYTQRMAKPTSVVSYHRACTDSIYKASVSRKKKSHLLLDAQLVSVPALLLAAVLSAGWQAGVALAADHLLAVEGLGKGSQRGVIHTTAQTQHQVQCALLLDVVVAQSAAVLQLLASEDQTLLVRWDACVCTACMQW